jgi:hypothetical protein
LAIHYSFFLRFFPVDLAGKLTLAFYRPHLPSNPGQPKATPVPETKPTLGTANTRFATPSIAP